MIAIKILELLILCDRLFSDSETEGKEQVYHPTIERYNELIEANFTRQRGVGFYAKTLNVHPAHLNFLVKKYNGTTAKNAIDTRIFMEAQSLLAATSCSIKEIADRLGFSNANYFSSFFSRMAEKAPSEYRAAMG